MKDSERPEVTVGRRVRDLRQQHGLSQQQVADGMAALGFSWRQTTVTKTEAGGRPVPVGELVALAELFGASVSDLIDTDNHQEEARALRDLLRTGSRLSEAERSLQAAEALRGEAARAFAEAQEQYDRLRADREREEEADHG